MKVSRVASRLAQARGGSMPALTRAQPARRAGGCVGVARRAGGAARAAACCLEMHKVGPDADFKFAARLPMHAALYWGCWRALPDMREPQLGGCEAAARSGSWAAQHAAGSPGLARGQGRCSSAALCRGGVLS